MYWKISVYYTETLSSWRPLYDDHSFIIAACMSPVFSHQSHATSIQISLIFTISEGAEGSKKLKYKCHTTKTLEMMRAFLKKKEVIKLDCSCCINWCNLCEHWKYLRKKGFFSWNDARRVASHFLPLSPRGTANWVCETFHRSRDHRNRNYAAM